MTGDSENAVSPALYIDIKMRPSFAPITYGNRDIDFGTGLGTKSMSNPFDFKDDFIPKNLFQ